MNLRKHLGIQLGLIAVLGATNSIASTKLDLNLSEEAFAAKLEASRIENPTNFSGSFMLTDDNGEMINLGFFTSGRIKNADTIVAGLGGRAYYFNADFGDSLFSLGLGGFVEVSLPVEGLSIDSEFYHAPSILTTNDYDGTSELAIVAKYNLLENADIYAGFRSIEVGDTIEFEEGIYLGFEIVL